MSSFLDQLDGGKFDSKKTTRPKTSTEQVLRRNFLNPADKNFRISQDASIEFINRKGDLEEIVMGDPRFEEARKKLPVAQQSELNRLIEEKTQRETEALQDAKIREFGLPELGESPPEEIRDYELARTPIARQDPSGAQYGESLTEFGVRDQRRLEEELTTAGQGALNAKIAELSPQLASARRDLEVSEAGQRQYERGYTDISTLRARKNLESNREKVRLLENELERLSQFGLLEEHQMDPSRGKMEIQASQDAKRAKLKELEEERRILKGTLIDAGGSYIDSAKYPNQLVQPSPPKGLSGSMGERVVPEEMRAFSDLGEVISGGPVAVVASELYKRNQRDRYREGLKSKIDDLTSKIITLNDQVNRDQYKLDVIPETLPLSDAERDDLMLRDQFDLRQFPESIVEPLPNIEGDPFAGGLPNIGEGPVVGVPYLEDEETGFRDYTYTEPLSDEEYEALYGSSEQDIPGSLGPKIKSSDTSNSDDVSMSNKDTGAYGAPGRRF